MAEYCHLFGEVQVTPEGRAVACWLTPGQTAISVGRILRSGGILTPFKLGLGSFLRLQAFQNYIHHEHARHMPEPHYYLYLLGVDPGQQGQGLGGQLVSAMLERADREGKLCYLETQNETNVPFYVRLGFQVTSVGEVRSGSSRLKVWTMRRSTPGEPMPDQQGEHAR